MKIWETKIQQNQLPVCWQRNSVKERVACPLFCILCFLPPKKGVMITQSRNPRALSSPSRTGVNGRGPVTRSRSKRSSLRQTHISTSTAHPQSRICLRRPPNPQKPLKKLIRQFLVRRRSKWTQSNCHS